MLFLQAPRQVLDLSNKVLKFNGISSVNDPNFILHFLGDVVEGGISDVVTMQFMVQK